MTYRRDTPRGKCPRALTKWPRVNAALAQWGRSLGCSLSGCGLAALPHRQEAKPTQSFGEVSNRNFLGRRAIGIHDTESAFRLVDTYQVRNTKAA